MLGVEEAARVQAEGRARESVYFRLRFAVTLKLLGGKTKSVEQGHLALRLQAVGAHRVASALPPFLSSQLTRN